LDNALAGPVPDALAGTFREDAMTRLDALRLLLAKQDAPARHEWITRTLHLLASVTRRAA
jgi:hypothetical protein